VTRPAPATLLAGGAFLAGGIGIVSALTPDIAARSELVRGVLPPGVPAAARVLALAFGIVLIAVSRKLRRGSRRAWQLAVALVVLSAVAHLAKALDFEEATATLLLLAALWHWRHEFTVRGDPATIAPLLRALVALGALGFTAWLLSLPDRVADAVGVIAAGVAARALYLWLRPLAQRHRQSRDDRARAEAIVEEYGHDTLAFFKLRKDAAWFFSPSGRAFLAYRVSGGTAVIGGDPVGPSEELPALLAAFSTYAHANGWRVTALGVSCESLPVYRAAGFKSIYLGDEAIVRPEQFSLEGRRIRKVRQSVARLERAGYRVRVVRAESLDERSRSEVERVSRAWLARSCERGFAMAHDVLFAPATVLALAEGPDGKLGGFMQLVPAPASGGWSLSVTRRDRATPNGLMEFLIVRAVEWARTNGAAELSLNFAVFGGLMRAEAGWRSLARRALLRFDGLFQLERLYSFSAKFAPEWHARHLCFESWPGLPSAALACLRAESLLTPPGPWVRWSA
jgi:lysyl-tRNA synthetase, class II